MIDPDHRAIVRQRRQQGRCVACGSSSLGRGGWRCLCAVCKVDLMFCPTCETTYPRICQGKTSLPCHACRRRALGRRPAVQVYNARHTRYTQRLSRVVRRYRAGMTIPQIAADVGSTVAGIKHLINRARAAGDWPTGLRRFPQKARG